MVTEVSHLLLSCPPRTALRLDSVGAVANMARRRETASFTRSVAALSVLTVALIGVTIFLWAFSLNLTRVIDTRTAYWNAALLGLFAVAGALGGVLRSFAYLLAYRNLSAREQSQWRLEALVGPILGAVAGMGAYFVVVAAVADGPSAVNRSGQYLVSLLAGAAALSQFGKLAERGVLRSGLSRSGILGTEPSVTAPLLERLDRMLEQRVAEISVVNYDGVLAVRQEFRRDPEVWLLEAELIGDPRPDVRPGREFPASSGASPIDDRGATRQAPIRIAGGEDREVVAFMLTAVSEDLDVSPLSFSVSAPAVGQSVPVTFVLTGRGASRRPTEPASAVVEVSQGAQTVQLLALQLASPDVSPSGPSPA